MEKTIYSLAKRITTWIRIAILAIMLFVVVAAILGFVSRWGTVVLYPQNFLANIRFVTEDVFAILVVFELLELLRTMSPTRLTDLLLLILARKIVLSLPQEDVLLDVVSFFIVLFIRLLWSRFLKKEAVLD
jgi:hypothetical protein